MNANYNACIKNAKSYFTREEKLKLISLMLALPSVSEIGSCVNYLLSLPPCTLPLLTLPAQPLATLFNLYQKGDLKAVSALLPTLKNLDNEGIIRRIRVEKMRILSKQASITFKQLADVLEVDSQNITEWVILAIQNNVVEARIDEFNQIVEFQNQGEQPKESDLAQVMDRLKLLDNALTKVQV